MYAWVVLGLFQVVWGPFLLYISPKFAADRWWAWGRLVGWLFASLTLWILGHLKVPIDSTELTLGIVLVISSLLFVFNLRHRKEIKKIFMDRWRQILAEEVLFGFGFVFMSMMRGFNPEILDLEKFMDAGFMAGYLKTTYLPAEDMWLSGMSVNYYTFGHFMGAVMTRIWGLRLEVTYNLLLGLIMGLSLTGTYSVVLNMISTYMPHWNRFGAGVGGLIGAIALVFGGNSHAAWSFLANKTFDGYWYANATRFIEFTIHEFPAYSFVVSDLHAHVWGLPIVLMFLCTWIWAHHQLVTKETSYESSFVMGTLFGVMLMTNTWDVMVYGGLLLLDFGYIFLVKRVNFMKMFVNGIMVMLGMFVTGCWWFLNFQSISEGVWRVTQSSPLWQLLAIWGGHLIVAGFALFLNSKIGLLKGRIKINTINPLISLMILMAIGLIIFPEFYFFKDIYPTHPRANTMFKLTYQSFVLLSIVLGWMFGTLVSFRSRIKGVVRLTVLPLAMLCIFAFMLFPYFAYRDYYNSFNDIKPLDGYTWLLQSNPDDYKAIMWLRDTVDSREVVLEAVGESYTRYARVSSITGLPTVLGWRVHEWLWRNGFEIPSERTQEVKDIYTEPSSDNSKKAIAKYSIKYIFLGDLERENYNIVDDADLTSLGEVVFESGNTKIIRLE